MNSKLNRFLMSPWAFPLLFAMATAAVIAGTHMYIVDGHGAFNEIFVTQLMDKGLKGGDYAGAAGFAAGFLVARLLEGPLVGVLDLGGALMTGLGIGIPAVMLSAGIRWPLESFPVSLLLGAVIGGVIGALIILVRKLMPEGMAASGTDVMMGAGNAMGQWLGPIIILSAIQYSIPAGLGSFVGAAAFYYWKRPIAGGAILGAMILGALFPVIAK
ncbi:MAG TPA: DUF4310 family protein [Symbiobacteriaceae bacterium]|nr:DUF4310 family protein [Symbiobacteriaceae bacterium]